MSILVVGSIAYDSIKTPEKEVEKILGGSAVYFSSVASFYTDVAMVGVAGDDFRNEDLEWLKSRKIDVSGIDIVKGGKTFHWKGEYGATFADAETHATELNVFETFKPELNKAQRDADFVFLANIHPALQLQVLEQVERPKLTIMDTMNFWIDTCLDDLKKVFEKVDVLLINLTEARMFTGEQNYIKCGEKLLEHGPKRVVIKMGEFGAISFVKMANGFHYFFGPIFPTTTIADPTGCGDSFAGGYVGYLAACGSLDEKAFDLAVLHGSVMGSFTLENFSIDRYRTLKPEEIVTRVEQCLTMTQCDWSGNRKLNFIA